MKGLTIFEQQKWDGVYGVYIVKAGNVIVKFCETNEEAVELVKAIDTAYGVAA